MKNQPDPFRYPLRWYSASWRKRNEEVVAGMLADQAAAEGRVAPTRLEHFSLMKAGLVERYFRPRALIAGGVAGVVAVTAVVIGTSISSTPGPVRHAKPIARSLDASDLNFPAYYDLLPSIVTDLDAVARNFPDVNAGDRLDSTGPTVEVLYNSTAPPNRVSAFKSAISKIKVPDPLSIDLVATDWAIADRQNLAAAIGTNPQTWSNFFGAKVTGTYVDPSSGIIHVALDPAPPTTRTRTTLKGFPVILEGPMRFDFQVATGSG